MSSIEAAIAFFRIEIGRSDQTLTRDLIRKMVEDSPFSHTKDEREEIIRHLEASFDIEQQPGATISSEHHPWLASRRPDIDFYYWNRLKQYYVGEDSLPLHVISVLDQVTNSILDHSGDPSDEASWKRRGMVMGHVQSGKTTNYAALICKAADAGYRVVILLAGITNSLRAQTQERLDESFIGKKSVFQAPVVEPLSIVNYSDRKRFPAYGTSRDRDFSKAAAATYGVHISALREPIIFVTKKNKATLERLRDWLLNENHGNTIHYPLLLIDDEADNASINTASDPTRATAINAAIRGILALFTRSTYVGYTATPFANIFIDPASEDEMRDDDLFPRHFITALDPPSNYCGATRIFSESGDLRGMQREIADHEDLLPLKHKKDHQIHALPESLREATRLFILARAVRILRGDATAHASMMINVSRFNDVQERINGLVYGYVEQVRSSILVNAGIGLEGLKDKNMRALASDFHNEYRDVEFSFNEVRNVLNLAAGDIAVRTINMRGGELDYSKHKKEGLRVIAVGGLALSRGLTLEGLTISYMLRNASASDTLMQMARWFGYRSGYEDLCRLYLPEQSIDHYEYITEAVEELRAEVKSMSLSGLTPENFGLRVRQSPAAIRITAANKMRSATEITLAQDYSGRHVEGYALPADRDRNSRNLEQTLDFVEQLGKPVESTKRELIWRGVSGSRISRLLSGFDFSAAHTDLGPIQAAKSLFQFYLEDRIGFELANWDIAIPMLGNSDREHAPLDRFRYLLRRRKEGEIKEQTYRVTRKNKAANPGDEQIALSEEALARARNRVEESGGSLSLGRACCAERETPLMLIHLLEVANSCHERIGDVVATLSFCMPSTSIPAVARTYQVNAVYREQILHGSIEPDDDDVPMLDEQNDV